MMPPPPRAAGGAPPKAPPAPALNAAMPAAAAHDAAPPHDASFKAATIPSWATAPPMAAAPHKLETYKNGVLIDVLDLTSASLVVGRDASLAGGLSLAHPSVSRRHAALVHDKDRGLFLVDFGSAYGTTLDGVKLVPNVPAGPIVDGATLRFAVSSRAYVMRLGAWTAGDGTGDLRTLELPISFGNKRKEATKLSNDLHGAAAHARTDRVDVAATEAKRKREENPDAVDGVDAARAKLAERRSQRAAEVDALAQGMISSVPMYSKWTPDDGGEDDARAHQLVADDADVARRRRKREADDAGDEDENLEDNAAAEGDAAAVTAMLAKRWDVPISHEISLGGHAKTVSCVAVDPSGTRVLTGSVDYKVRLYDFGGMDKHHRSFREIEPEDGHPVVALSFSPGSGDRFLCCTGSAQPQVFTREGVSLLKFNRGDPYVTDMARTSGHVTIVTGGEWHPHENMQCLTSGRDGSVRIWDLCGKTGLRDYLLCDQTIRVRDKAARKCSATCVTYSPDGKRVACGAADGSLQLWQTASATLVGKLERRRKKRFKGEGWQVKGRAHNYLRPDARVDSAHSPGTDASGCIISAVSFSPDGHTLASRADDGYVKLWDARKLKTCLASFGGVPAHHATANLAWRPDGAVVCAGTAAPDANSPGALRFFSACGPQHELHQDAGGYKPLISVGVAKGTSVVSVLWHERIRHVFCGTSAGETRVMYDPDLSVKGALVTVRRDHAKRVVGLDSFHIDSASIINPMALPMYRDDSFYKKKGAYSKNRNDPIKSKKPAPPLESGQQGRNTGGRSTFCQFYIENNLPASIRGDDPRAELLKYADKEPIFRTEATFYRDKEGKQLMDTETLEAAQSKFVDDQKKLLDRTGRK